MQTEHYNFKSSQPKSHIIVACNNLAGPANVGSLFRLAEAMGVEQLLFDTTINATSRRMQKTARSTFKNLEYIEGVDLLEVMKQYKEAGYTLLGLEVTSVSQPIQSIHLGNQDKWLLLIGNEQNGLDNSLLKAVEYQVHLPMFGNNSSMNVIQATAMALYELRRDE